MRLFFLCAFIFLCGERLSELFSYAQLVSLLRIGKQLMEPLGAYKERLRRLREEYAELVSLLRIGKQQYAPFVSLLRIGKQL